MRSPAGTGLPTQTSPPIFKFLSEKPPDDLGYRERRRRSRFRRTCDAMRSAPLHELIAATWEFTSPPLML